MKLNYLSASRIKTFEQCGLKYFGIYEEGLEDSPHPLTIMGSAVHKGAEDSMNEIIAGREASFTSAVRQACAQMGVTKPNADLARELIENALSWGYTRNADKCVGLEVSFFEALPCGTKVKGFIDRLDIDLPTADVIDLKTQKSEFNDATLADEWQSVVYNWAARKLYPELTGDISVSYWVLRHRVQRVWMTADDAKRGEDKLMKVAEQIRSCTDPQPQPTALCQWCPKRGTCPAANEGVKARFNRKFKK